MKVALRFRVTLQLKASVEYYDDSTLYLLQPAECWYYVAGQQQQSHRYCVHGSRTDSRAYAQGSSRLGQECAKARSEIVCARANLV